MVTVAATCTALSPRERALASALLAHHRRVREHRAAIDASACLITAERLCVAAGMPGFATSVAVALVAIAQWCAERGWPPLNSLVVNKETGKPSSYYRLAPGCSVVAWRDEVRACLAFRSYPFAA